MLVLPKVSEFKMKMETNFWQCLVNELLDWINLDEKTYPKCRQYQSMD